MLKTLKPKTTVALRSLEGFEKRTQPPARLTESKLISTLDEMGLGRPSTFSTIVSVIQERGYVQKVSGQQLAPTFLGFAVVRLLTTKFPEFTSYDYTARMEKELDEISEGKVTRSKFLGNFWNGSKGFSKTIESLMSSIDWEEIRKITTIELDNGYSITFNKFGAFLQDNNGEPNEKGYLPSVKIDDNGLVEEYLDAEACKEVFIKSANRIEARELGELSSGVYKGWLVTARDGKFGPFLQATKGKEKPINHALPETLDLATVSLEDVKSLFEEVKLPRHLNDQYFTGIGKRGPWLAFKATPKSRRATFRKLPEELDPRTVTLEEAKAAWDAGSKKK